MLLQWASPPGIESGSDGSQSRNLTTRPFGGWWAYQYATMHIREVKQLQVVMQNILDSEEKHNFVLEGEAYVDTIKFWNLVGSPTRNARLNFGSFREFLGRFQTCKEGGAFVQSI